MPSLDGIYWQCSQLSPQCLGRNSGMRSQHDCDAVKSCRRESCSALFRACDHTETQRLRAAEAVAELAAHPFQILANQNGCEPPARCEPWCEPCYEPAACVCVRGTPPTHRARARPSCDI